MPIFVLGPSMMKERSYFGSSLSIIFQQLTLEVIKAELDEIWRSNKYLRGHRRDLNMCPQHQKISSSLIAHYVTI